VHGSEFPPFNAGVTTINRISRIRMNPYHQPLAGLDLEGTINMTKSTVGFFSFHVVLRFQATYRFSFAAHNKTFFTVFLLTQVIIIFM